MDDVMDDVEVKPLDPAFRESVRSSFESLRLLPPKRSEVVSDRTYWDGEVPDRLTLVVDKEGVEFHHEFIRLSVLSPRVREEVERDLYSVLNRGVRMPTIKVGETD